MPLGWARAYVRPRAPEHVVLDQPEAAREKRAVPWSKAIPVLLGFVSQDEFVMDEQSVLDRPDRSLDARIRRMPPKP